MPAHSLTKRPMLMRRLPHARSARNTRTRPIPRMTAKCMWPKGWTKTITGAASCLSWSMVSLKSAAEARIAERVYPHSLRHSVATILLERGMPIEQIRKLLGHTRLESTQVCVQSTTAMVKASYQKVLSG